MIFYLDSSFQFKKKKIVFIFLLILVGKVLIHLEFPSLGFLLFARVYGPHLKPQSTETELAESPFWSPSRMLVFSPN